MNGGRSGAPLRAWAPLDARPLELVFWDRHLPDQSPFFRTGVPAEFYDAPAGGRVAFPLAGEGRDYTLYPLGVDGSWMRVRVVTPADACGREPASPRSAELWIRYLDETGRPRLWYPTRGC